MRLLIVDDEPIAIQGILHGVDLGQLGFSDVFTANSYMEAVEILEKETVDLAICDIEMPDQSGLELMDGSRSIPRTRRRSFSAVTMSLLTPSRPCACTAWSMC